MENILEENMRSIVKNKCSGLHSGIGEEGEKFRSKDWEVRLGTSVWAATFCNKTYIAVWKYIHSVGVSNESIGKIKQSI